MYKKVFFSFSLITLTVISASAANVSCKLTAKTIAHVESPTIQQIDEVSAPNIPGAPLLYHSSKTDATASIQVNAKDRKVYASLFRVLGFSTSSGWVDLDYGYQNTEWTTVLTYEDPEKDLSYEVSCKR